jgi:hypothetical protein
MKFLLETAPMPKLPIFRLRNSEPSRRPELNYCAPVLCLSGLQLGVDNLRYDVFLSPRTAEGLSLHLARYIRRFGDVESLFDLDVPASPRSPFLRPGGDGAPSARKTGPADLKSLLVSLHLAVLNRAKADDNPSIDLLGRLAVLKFIRTELHVQFAKILEQCRVKSKSLEGFRQSKMLETRELVSSFQVRKKIILRRTGQEVLRLLREIEKETLARTRRSLLGDLPADPYRLFLNPLLFTDDGRDDYLCAERYYMFGNFDKDPDRFANLRRLALDFLRQLGYAAGENGNHLEFALNVPDNAATLVGTGSDDAAAEDHDREIRLKQWTRLLQQDGVLPYVLASYEAVPLLGEYAPRVNPQQVKNALIMREEAERVEKILAEGKLPPDRLFAAAGRVASCRGEDRSRIAARLLRDIFCYHRDLRGLEAVAAGLDSINLVSDDKMRELSALNGILYEFLPPEDQRSSEERVLHHVILKADVRDSCRLTRSLNEKGMNAASYFSLNFYEPVNKLLAKYGADKVFLEGDAIILALLDREGEAMVSVSRACVLANEILSLLRGYNLLLARSGLPQMEVGLGIANQDSPPLYLMDGERRIMISDAINESDRLSSCNKRVRKKIAPDAGIFQVYSVLIGSTASAETSGEELRFNYNVGGICISESAFRKMQQEISLTPWHPDFTGRWTDQQCEYFVGTVPLVNGTFRRLVVRKSRIAQVDVRDLSIVRWTDRYYYEVCANPAVEAALPGEESAGAGQSR